VRFFLRSLYSSPLVSIWVSNEKPVRLLTGSALYVCRIMFHSYSAFLYLLLQAFSEVGSRHLKELSKHFISMSRFVVFISPLSLNVIELLSCSLCCFYCWILSTIYLSS
jgi:hypothetical protein